MAKNMLGKNLQEQKVCHLEVSIISIIEKSTLRAIAQHKKVFALIFLLLSPSIALIASLIRTRPDWEGAST